MVALAAFHRAGMSAGTSAARNREVRAPWDDERPARTREGASRSAQSVNRGRARELERSSARENGFSACGAEDCPSPEPGTSRHDAEGEFRRRRQGAQGSPLREGKARLRERFRARDHGGHARARTRRSGSGRAADGPGAAADQAPKRVTA